MIINDKAIKKLAVMHVVEAINKGEVDYLQAAGLSKEVIVKLAEVKDVNQLLQMIHLTVRIDPQRLIELHQENEYLEYFVRHNATPWMLEKYFRIYGRKGADETFLRRQSKRRRGRTPALDPKTESLVFNVWSSLSAIADERMRLILLHQQFPDWPLSSLFGAIHEDNDK